MPFSRMVFTVRYLGSPAGLDRGILLGLPLRDRTHRRLLEAGLMKGDSPLTLREAIRMPNVNLVSLRQAIAAADAFLNLREADMLTQMGSVVRGFEGKRLTCATLKQSNGLDSGVRSLAPRLVSE